MASLSMESTPPNPWFNAINAQCTVQEQSEPDAVLPAHILGSGDAPFNMQRDQPLHIQFEWSQSGFFSALPLGAILNYEIKFLFEAWGSTETAAGLDLTAIVPFQAGNGFVYNFASAPLTRIVVPPNTLPVGVYEGMAIFQVNFIGTGEKYFAGFTKFSVLNVYNASV